MFFFFVYTGVTNILFGLYECEDFEYDDGTVKLLKQDYSVDCRSEKHTSSKIYGYFMLAVYPIGIPLAYLSVLHMHRYKLTCDAYRDQPGNEELSIDALYKVGFANG